MKDKTKKVEGID